MGTRDDLLGAVQRASKRPVPAPDPDRFRGAWQVVGDNYWWSIEPPEALAIAPRLNWSNEVKRLALIEYEETHAQELEPGQYYVMLGGPRLP